MTAARSNFSIQKMSFNRPGDVLRERDVARPVSFFESPCFHEGVFNMTQLELNRAVARATGESWRTIADRGFNLVDVSEPVTDADFEALAVDWDAVLAARQVSPLVASAA
jgi:hypothetical protein